jgi:hypothetical protein
LEISLPGVSLTHSLAHSQPPADASLLSSSAATVVSQGLHLTALLTIAAQGPPSCLQAIKASREVCSTLSSLETLSAEPHPTEGDRPAAALRQNATGERASERTNERTNERERERESRLCPPPVREAVGGKACRAQWCGAHHGCLCVCTELLGMLATATPLPAQQQQQQQAAPQRDSSLLGMTFASPPTPPQQVSLPPLSTQFNSCGLNAGGYGCAGLWISQGGRWAQDSLLGMSFPPSAAPPQGGVDLLGTPAPAPAPAAAEVDLLAMPAPAPAPAPAAAATEVDLLGMPPAGQGPKPPEEVDRFSVVARGSVSDGAPFLSATRATCTAYSYSRPNGWVDGMSSDCQKGGIYSSRWACRPGINFVRKSTVNL